MTRYHVRTSFVIISLILVVTAACAPSHQEPDPTPYSQQYGNVAVVWDAPHSALLNLKGKVSSVLTTETMEDNSTDVNTQFDTHGRLTFYNPTGLDIEVGPNRIKTRSAWGPTGTMAYSYSYDQNGRIASISQQEFNIPTITYTLHYGSHGKYIPLPLPMATLPLFLVKDLESVIADNGSFEYIFNGTTASYESRQWLSTVLTTFTIGKIYPTHRTVETKRGESLLRKEETIFAFGEHGLPLGSTYRLYEEESTTPTTQVTETMHQPFLLPATRRVEQGLSISNYRWNYSIEGHLIKAHVETTTGNSNSILSEIKISGTTLDTYSNWTSMTRTVTGNFDESLQEGNTNLKQKIEYYK